MSTPDLDWTFAPAPWDDEPTPSGAPRRPRFPGPRAAWRLSRRTWLLLAALAALAVALTVAVPKVQNSRDRQAVEQVVARQEQARLAGDWFALRATYANDSVGWAQSRVLRMQNGWLPTPISLPGLRPDGRPGRVSGFQVAGPQLARADVERGFVLADGTRVTFAMPQFYQFAQGAWLQTPPPDVPRDQVQYIHTARVDVTYYPDDADLAASLARDLDDLLGRACADWSCPPELRVAVVFDPSDSATAASAASFEPLLGSTTLEVILGRPSAYPNLGVNLASRVTGGYPADAHAAEAVRRAAGVQALIRVAQQLTPNLFGHGENAYLDALIAREASRLGIDQPGLAQLQIANPLFQPADLWSIPLLHFSSAGALPEALVILNHVLASSDLTVEARLMHAFDQAQNPDTWLAPALGWSTADAHNALLDAAFNVNGTNNWVTYFPPVQPAGFAPDFALSCPGGPVLAMLGGQTAPLLAGQFPDSVVESWSPDGHSLALRVSGRLAVVDLQSQTGQFVPQASFEEGIPPAWLSSTMLVYPATSAGMIWSGGNSGLVYFGTRAPQSFSTDPNFVTYLPSPDGKWAALQGQPYGAEPSLVVASALPGLTLMSAASAYNPAWSLDSQHLAFASLDTAPGVISSLVVFDTATGDERTVFPGSGPGVPAADEPTTLTAAWSPSGDRLALASLSYTGGGYTGWAATLAPDGSAFRLLPAAQANLAPGTLAYSADGRYLALNWFQSRGATVVAVYSAEGALLRWLPGYQFAAWSPTGHSLALTSVDGVSLLGEPGADPRNIGPAGCVGLAWRP